MSRRSEKNVEMMLKVIFFLGLCVLALRFVQILALAILLVKCPMWLRMLAMAGLSFLLLPMHFAIPIALLAVFFLIASSGRSTPKERAF